MVPGNTGSWYSLRRSRIFLGRHDLSYRLFFSHHRMVRDLLREILGESWVERLDLASGERVNASFVNPLRKNRESDVIWKFERRDGGDPVYIYILLEFQSKPDRYMAVRLMTYISLLYEQLIAGGHLPPSGQLPLVIPIVLYNGTGPWRAALRLEDLIDRLERSLDVYVPQFRYKLIHEADYSLEKLQGKQSPVADLFRLERSRSWDEVRQGIASVREHVPPEEAGLRRAFGSWLEEVILPRLGMAPDEVPPKLTLEEMDNMLAERIDEWNRTLREESLQEGLQKGLQKGEARALLRLLERRFGFVKQSLRDRIGAADSDLLLDWIDRAAIAESLDEVFAR